MIAPEKNNTHSSWVAEVSLEFINRFDKTVPGRCSRKGPLTFQRPFYPEGNTCHLYLLHPPGGVVGGDRIDLDIKVKENAHALITTPGAAKFYLSQGSDAFQNQTFAVADNSLLEWFPQETILFPGSKPVLSTQVDLDEKAEFIGWDILCFGRPASSMTFESGTLTGSFSIFRQGIPLYIDRLTVDTDKDPVLGALPGLKNYPITAMFAATGISDTQFDITPFSDPDSKDVSIKGATLINDLLIARYLGHDPEEAKQYFISIWETIRPLLCGKPACVPRIWAT